MTLPIRKHKGRNDLVGEHPRGDLLQVVLISVFLSVWVTDSFFLHLTDFLRAEVPVLLRIVAAATIMLPGYFCVRLAHRAVFGTIRDKPVLLREGIFSVVRHPLYLGSILMILSLGLLTLSLASLLLWAGIVAFYAYISGYEENALVDQFGEDYEKYRREVPMLFPRLSKK